MAAVQLSVGLALLASVFSGLQAICVEYGLSNGDAADDRSPTLAAAVISITVGVGIFWILVFVRRVPLADVTLLKLAPFAIAGLANPAAFRLLYFRSIDRIGARFSAAAVSANPVVAVLLAALFLGESLTVATGLGLGCIVVGVVVLQASGTAADTHHDLLAAELARLDLSDLLVPTTAMGLLGGSFVLVKFGLDRYPEPLVATAVGQSAALAAFVALLSVSRESRRRVQIRDRTMLVAFVLAGTFVAANWLAWFSALQIGTVLVVVPLSNLYPLVVVAISYAVARQFPTSPRILVGITSIVVGASVMQMA